ncbi:MAG: 2Fe-2S iron-sulfur cluster-binding protein [Gammaproteobacteria bacterium]|nr:2Fe-2S iron-sulfur cluster-binding protein [Gammaproteobacteria bacterium]
MPTFKVTLLPSGHRYFASPKQSLLQAGLESGFNLPYGCEGGNCGECLARLEYGEIQSLRHSDFVLSESQKNKGYFLTCCHTAFSDCQLELHEIHGVNEIPQQNIEARVYKLENLAHDVMSISLKTPRTQPLRFLAGQHITVALNKDLRSKRSIASCPCDGLKPEIHVKLRKQDAFSQYVFKHLKRNDRILIQGPMGEFILDDDSQRRLIFIAYDTGFAGIKSLLEHAIALEKEQSISLYWIVTPHSTPYLENYCRSIEDALDNVTFYPLSIKEASEKCFESVLKKIFKQEDQGDEVDGYIILPESFRSLTLALINRYGLDGQRWRLDGYQIL